jgi:hypothetical protein
MYLFNYAARSKRDTQPVLKGMGCHSPWDCRGTIFGPQKITWILLLFFPIIIKLVMNFQSKIGFYYF